MIIDSKNTEFIGDYNNLDIYYKYRLLSLRE